MFVHIQIPPAGTTTKGDLSTIDHGVFPAFADMMEDALAAAPPHFPIELRQFGSRQTGIQLPLTIVQQAHCHEKAESLDLVDQLAGGVGAAAAEHCIDVDAETGVLLLRHGTLLDLR